MTKLTEDQLSDLKPGVIYIERIYTGRETFGGYLPRENHAFVKSVSRIDHPKFVRVGLSRPISDDELCDLHDHLRTWRPK